MHSPSDDSLLLLSSSLDSVSQATHHSTTCYFTYVPSPSHFSAETPCEPLTAYSEDIEADCWNPLLASRPAEHLSQGPALNMDPSKLLQLQTAVAHGQLPTRPRAQPLQATGSSTSIASTTSTNSSTSSTTSEQTLSMPSGLCCARCRRNSVGAHGMVQFGTNLYYCSHCASMTGYSAG